MTWNDRLQQKFDETGWSKRELSRRANVSYDNVIKYLSGKVDKPRGDTLGKLARAVNTTSIWLERGLNIDEGYTEVPIMGYVGVGAVINPIFKLPPAAGRYQITLTFTVPEEIIAFVVKGESMLPKYNDGDVIVALRDQRRNNESFYGEEAIVETSDGRRFLKQIVRSNENVMLMSWNALPIENITLAWIGEIYAIIPGRQFRLASKNGTKQ